MNARKKVSKADQL